MFVVECCIFIGYIATELKNIHFIQLVSTLHNSNVKENENKDLYINKVGSCKEYDVTKLLCLLLSH